MKTKLVLFTTIISLFFLACSAPYYQMYKAIPSDTMKNMDNSLVYEDENCKISYNLWSDGGNIGFRFYNKTEQDIYLNLEQSFFILNGVAYDYYKNRVYSNSTYSSTSASAPISNTVRVGFASSLGNSTSYAEKNIVCIPSKASKIITEYTINEIPYRDCDLLRFPKMRQISTETFNKDESPYVFSNRIAYNVGQSENLIKLENEFYISEISNYPESEFITIKYLEFCGQKSSIITKEFIKEAPDSFYIQFLRGSETLLH